MLEILRSCLSAFSNFELFINFLDFKSAKSMVIRIMTNMTMLMTATNTWILLAIADLCNCDIFIIFCQSFKLTRPEIIKQ